MCALAVKFVEDLFKDRDHFRGNVNFDLGVVIRDIIVGLVNDTYFTHTLLSYVYIYKKGHLSLGVHVGLFNIVLVQKEGPIHP